MGHGNGNRWFVVTNRWPRVGCGFRYKWRARIHTLIHLEPSWVVGREEFIERRRRQ